MRRITKSANLIPALFSSFFILIIVAAFTWPIISHFTSYIPGVDEDSATHVWYLWWFKWAFVEGHSNLFVTDWIFHPQMVNRIFDVHTFTNAALSLPGQYLFGVIAASNSIFYLNFFLLGFGSFLLTKKVTGSDLGAFISSLIISFMPYTWGQMLDNHTNLYTIWFIPFYLLFLLKSLKEKSWLNPIGAGIFFGLQSLNDLTLSSFMASATMLIGFYYLLFIPGTILNKSLLNIKLGFELVNWKTIFRLLLLGGVFLIIFLPLFIPTLNAIRSGLNPSSSLTDQAVWSAWLNGFITPSGNNPYLIAFSRIGLVNSIEGSIYLGFTALFLGLIAVIYFNLKNKREGRKEFLLWPFLFISFFILSLGPCASYLGINLHLSFCNGLPLPFIFFHKIPLIGGIQEPIRMQIYTMISLAVLAGFGVKALEKIIKRKWLFPIIASLAILIIIEYYTPLPYTDLTPPPIYRNISQDHNDFAVLSLPVGWNNQSFNTGYSPIGSLQFFQSVHEHKGFRATVARIPTSNIFYYLDKPLFKYLTQPDKRMPDKDDLNTELVKKTFGEMNIKYIVIHKNLYDPKKGRVPGRSLELIETVLKATKISEDDNTVSYRID